MAQFQLGGDIDIDMPGSKPAPCGPPIPEYDEPDAMEELLKCAGLRPSCMGVGPKEEGWKPE